MPQVGQTALYEDVLNFVGAASTGIKRAMDEVEVHRAQAKRAADLAPSVLDQLLQHGLILPHEKQAAAAMLAEHASTLQLLKRAADRLAEAEASGRTKKAAVEPGRAEGETPAYDSQSDPYTGRRTTQKKASDAAILRVLDR